MAGAPPTACAPVHLVVLPMDDADENAIIVNAIQRHAYVVVQKSIVEGFGLTVTEAMWKSRPVIATAVGGIQDQITDGRDGLLIADPHDLDEFAGRAAPAGRPGLADRLGRGRAGGCAASSSVTATSRSTWTCSRAWRRPEQPASRISKQSGRRRRRGPGDQ